MPRKPAYAESVFINCPFDAEYRGMFYALVFAVYDCGFTARSAQEVVDAGEVRIQRILRLIKESRFGIHDISRTQLDAGTKLPRFNMPLELGIFIGAKTFGQGEQRRKITLVLERRPYSYQRYCSDIAGQDIGAHHGRVGRAITVVRNWLSSHSNKPMPGGRMIAARYRIFSRQLPRICAKVNLDVDELTFSDYTALVVNWLKEEQRALLEAAR